MVCKLKKSLYGLKQAPRQWYKKFDSFMVSYEYKRTDADHCVYFRKFTDGNFIILLLYVDDMLIAGNDSKLIDKLKERLFKSFDMKCHAPNPGPTLLADPNQVPGRETIYWDSLPDFFL